MMRVYYRSFGAGRACLTALVAVVAGLFLAHPAAASGYQQVNLVSDVAREAVQTDTDLINPWGIAVGPTGPFWVADNGAGVATTLTGGELPGRLVTIPPPPGSTGPATPTGIAFNNSSDFDLAPGHPAQILFATEDGTIAGWNPDVDAYLARVMVNNSASAVYKGLATANHHLYACNFRGSRIDVFNSDFTRAGSVTDATLPAGYAPFNIQNLGGTLFVTFAEQDTAKKDDVPGAGHGFVETYDPAAGTFRRLISRGLLDSPWGMALAPTDFGQFSNALLIGNFGSGEIHAYNPSSGAFLGRVKTPGGAIITIPGLWGLTFGNGTDGGAMNILYFTAGLDHEQHGLFGNIQAVP